MADTNQDEVCTEFSLYLYNDDDEVLRFHGAENSKICKSENFLIFRPCFLKDIGRSGGLISLFMLKTFCKFQRMNKHEDE